MTESITPEPIQEPVSVDDNSSTLSIDDGGGAITVDGTVAATLSEPISVDDNGASLTVDNAALSVTGGGVEATALRVTLASDSTGVVSVDDNAGSLTVDGTVTANLSATDNAVLDQIELNTGPLLVVGSGTEATAQRVTIATDSTGVLSVDDNGASLTVDNATISVVGGGTEATAQRVTIANDSTGVISVDDNGGTLTVDGTVTANQGTAGTAWEIIGDVAADVAVPTNPVITGGRASTAVPSAVSADGDSVNSWLTRQGANVVSMAPHVGIFGSQPWNLTSETAQYTTTQTSTVLVAGGASERLVVTKVQIQVGGTTAGTLQLYFGTGAYSRGTSLAIFDGEFAPSATLKPGVIMDGPFISATNGDDLMVTDSAAINPLTITVWYYVVT